MRERKSPVPVFTLTNARGQQLESSYAIKSMQTIEEVRKTRPNEPPHRHDYYAIIFIEDASGKHFIDFKEFQLGNNMVFFIAPGQVHFMDVNSSPEGTVMLFTDEFLSYMQMTPSMLANAGLFHGIENLPLTLDEPSTQRLKQISNLILLEYENNPRYSKEIIGAYQKAFLLECSRHKMATETDKPNADSKTVSMVNNFRNQVDNSYRQMHKVSEYAKELCITPNYLSEMVKRYTGRTAKEYIQERLVLEARRNALHSNCSLNEITFYLGFKDPAHFSKFFKKHNGHTFQKYRRKVRDEHISNRKAPGQIPD